MEATVENAINKGAVDVQLSGPKTCSDCAIQKTSKMKTKKVPSPLPIVVESSKPAYFAGLDLTNFWSDDTDETTPVTDEMIAEAEKDLGFKLPSSYLALMRNRNGGDPKKTCFRTGTGEYEYFCICSIYGVHDLVGENREWEQEWEYPRLGVYICDTDSGGHELVCLDYRQCGPQGEPQVVHVDQEADYGIEVLAPNFEEFIRKLGLIPDEMDAD